jgi:hypothetical protein
VPRLSVDALQLTVMVIAPPEATALAEVGAVGGVVSADTVAPVRLPLSSYE